MYPVLGQFDGGSCFIGAARRHCRIIMFIFGGFANNQKSHQLFPYSSGSPPFLPCDPILTAEISGDLRDILVAVTCAVK